jgi:hypothetical protein
MSDRAIAKLRFSVLWVNRVFSKSFGTRPLEFEKSLTHEIATDIHVAGKPIGPIATIRMEQGVAG